MSEVKAVQKTEMPEINAQAAIVVTQHEGKILLEKNAKLKMYPAFVTKILASILALEKCNPSDIVTVSENAATEITKWKGSASISLQSGENISVLDLVYSMMLVSANDSMFALAEFICGGMDKFTAMMEEKAKLIGAVQTTLSDDNGHFTAEQFSTAYDMAIICRYCMTNRVFRMIASTDKYTIHATNKSEERIIQNTNLLVNSQNRRYRYETAIGIKSGFTMRSKACLACSALPPQGKYGEEILAIILGAENTKQMKYAFYDAITLFDFTFDNFEMLSGKKTEEQKTDFEQAFLTVSEISDAVGAVQRNAGDCRITAVAFGRQKIKNGCVYFAENESSAKSAAEKGAGLIITENAVPGIPCITVRNLESAKAKLAVYIKSKLGMWTVGILDCPEKINPLDMASQMLAEKMSIVKSASVDNNYSSMLKAILSSIKSTRAALVNVSCMNSGNVEKVSGTANFDVAIIPSTAVSKNPRELNKTELIEEKLKICKGMNEAGAVIINIDDKNLAGIFSIEQDVITIGVDNRMADYFADNISINQNKISFDIINGANNYRIELYSDDKHSVYQALATFALGEIMGVPPKQIIASIEKYRRTNGLNKVRNEKGIYVISDFENDTSESVGAAIKELCSTFIPDTARRIAVFAELGTDEEFETNMFTKVGSLINKCSVDIAVCYGDIPSAITQTADMKNKFIVKLSSKEALTEFLKLNIRENDAVLFKGSADTGLDDIMAEVT